jgi:hypothetical protein
MRCKAGRQGRRIRLVATSPRRRLLLSCDPTLRRVELGRGRDPRGRRNFGCECRWSVGNGVSPPWADIWKLSKMHSASLN